MLVSIVISPATSNVELNEAAPAVVKVPVMELFPEIETSENSATVELIEMARFQLLKSSIALVLKVPLTSSTVISVLPFLEKL